MNNFKVIYRILKYLEAAMDADELLVEAFTSKVLGVTEARWRQIIVLMQDGGYIKGVNIVKAFGGEIVHVDIERMAITLAGLEYLSDNSMMKKMANAAKGIAEVIT